MRGNSPHKVPVTRKMLPFDDVIECQIIHGTWRTDGQCKFCRGCNWDVACFSLYQNERPLLDHRRGIMFAPWWRHQMEIFSALLDSCTGNSPVIGEFPSQGPVRRSFDVFFDLGLNTPLSKQWWGWWFETPSRSLWRHCNVVGHI